MWNSCIGSSLPGGWGYSIQQTWDILVGSLGYFSCIMHLPIGGSSNLSYWQMDLFCLPWLRNIFPLILLYHTTYTEILRIVWLCDLLCCQVVRTSDLLALTTIEESLVYSELGIPPLNYLSHTLVFDIFEFKVPFLPIVTQEDCSECGYAHQPLGKLIVSTARFQSISLTNLSVICGVTHFWWKFPLSVSLVLLAASCCFLALWLFCYASLKWSFVYVMMVYYYAPIWYWNDSSAFNSAKYAGKPSTTTTSSDFVSLSFVLILSFCTVVIVEVTIVCVLCEISGKSHREKLWCFLQISHQRPMKFVKTCKLFFMSSNQITFE